MSDNIKEKLKHVWGRLTAGWHLDIEQAVPPSVIDNAMRQSSIPSFGYFFLLVMSGSIATFGLLSNSAPAIIGAMIIAPLMAPIMSLAHGLVIARYARIIRSFLTVLAGVLVVIALSYFVTELVGISIAGSEILSRTQPTTLDLGVAIAVALVPPLAVVGIGLAIGPLTNTDIYYALKEVGQEEAQGTIAGGAFLLFLTNLVAIVVSAGLVMICQGYGSIKRGLFGLAAMSGLMILLLKRRNA